MTRLLAISRFVSPRATLETETRTTVADYELVGAAATAQEAVRAAVTLSPDVLIMDVAMPGGSGIDATRRSLGRHRRSPS